MELILMMYVSRLVLLVSCAAAVGAAAGADLPARAALSRMPLRFEANQGQWKGGARFAARMPGYTLLLNDRGPEFRIPGSRPLRLDLLKSLRPSAVEGIEPLSAPTQYFTGPRDP